MQSITAFLTSVTIKGRDALEEIEIENPFFSSMRSLLVRAPAEACFALYVVIGMVELVVRPLIILGCLALSKTFKTQPFAHAVRDGWMPTGVFCLVNLFNLYFNLTHDSLEQSFQKLSKNKA